MPLPKWFCELNFSFDSELRESFRRGKLGHDWKANYPLLFDDDDVRLYKNQYKTHHFCEWYAAIVFFEALGYLSMAKYETKSHKLKRTPLKKIVTPEIYNYIIEDWGGMPDLIVFAPDYSKFFFCEVKGPRDKLHGRQSRCAKKLWQMSGKPVALLNLRQVV